MAERAQRARWLKSDHDPALQMPIMLDYVNDPPNADNAIKKAYWGGGSYSGYFIGCDGKVLEVKKWSWGIVNSPHYNFPLGSTGELHAMLDKYIASAPSCYDPGVVEPDLEPDEEVGCSVTGTGSGAPVLALLALLQLRRRRPWRFFASAGAEPPPQPGQLEDQEAGNHLDEVDAHAGVEQQVKLPRTDV